MVRSLWPPAEFFFRQTQIPFNRMNLNTSNGGLTKEQREQVEHFLDLFSDVEGALKEKLALQSDDRTSVSALINDYEARNPFWRDSANLLRHFKAIRNVLTHQRCTVFGYPLAVTMHSIEALREIKAHLIQSEPVSARYRRKVLTVSASDSLAHVLALSYDNGFSQFPVVDDGRFGGLVTENEIARWLGHRVKLNSAEVNLQNVSVRSVLKEKDPAMKGIPIFRFISSGTPVEEVMGRFSLETTLEVVLLTRDGDKHTPIEGIITQWDAARFS